MRPIPTLRPFCLSAAVLLAASPCTRADTATLVPTADAMVASASPTSNYGGAGAICVSAPGLSAGEFQSVLRFDTSAAVTQFNATFGVGQWTIESCSLKLTAFAPVIPFFNAQAAGQFMASWMANDSWSEGSGTPNMPATAGITFNALPTFLSAADEELGVFAFNGATSGARPYSLALTAGFDADLAAGGLVSIRLTAADTAISYLSNSRSFTTPSSFPTLAITAVAAPTCAADFNTSGGITVQDIFDFLTAWFAADPRADFNHANGITVQDIFDFLGAWFTGC